jgi:Flp pilus assembly protein TadD
MRTCPACNQEIAEGHNFCSRCGASLLSPALAAMIQDAHKALADNPGDTSARYNLAIAFKLAGMEELALEQLQQLAEAQSDFADVYYELGLLLAKHSRKEEAITALQQAEALDPEDSRASKLLAKLA